MAQDFHQKIYKSYDNYKEPLIKKKNFKHSEILPLINKLKKNKNFSILKIGESIEKREIFLVSIGTGEKNILLWSQMHGDESTATMALFDIFNFFSMHDELDSFKDKILSKIKLNFIPMLNPDGAERFQRRNALDIDLNRDAARLESPESHLLKSIRDNLKPEFGFNLHDQSRKYSAGNSFKSASISFLAPPANLEKEITPVRERAMKLIVELNSILSGIIPGHVGKYSDDFEPRAFGDNIQKWGTSTILIETGGWMDDLHKQFLRKINFTILLSAFLSIAEESYLRHNLKKYYSIPDNKENIFDLLIRNILVKGKNRYYKTDIGITRNEVTYGNNFIGYYSIIEDMGDLSTFYGYEEYCYDEKYEAVPGKIYPDVLESYMDVSKLDFEKLLKEGITTILVRKDLPKEGFSSYPILVRSVDIGAKIDNIAMNSPANFLIKQKDIVKFAIINGFVYNLCTSTNTIYNSVIVQ